jgi:hypothetical protein
VSAELRAEARRAAHHRRVGSHPYNRKKRFERGIRIVMQLLPARRRPRGVQLMLGLDAFQRQINFRYGRVFVGNKTLAGLARCSQSTILRAKQDAIAAGVLVIEKTVGGYTLSEHGERVRAATGYELPDKLPRAKAPDVPKPPDAPVDHDAPEAPKRSFIRRRRIAEGLSKINDAMTALKSRAGP